MRIELGFWTRLSPGTAFPQNAPRGAGSQILAGLTTI